MITVILAAIFVVLCLFAAGHDVATLRIPNKLNAAIALLFIPAAVAAGLAWQVAGWHIAAGAIAFAVSFLLFNLGVFGGGDAKMIPGVVLWLGPAGVYPFVFWMALSGGALVFATLLVRRFAPAEAYPGFAQDFRSKGAGVPYGVAIAVGAIVAAPMSPVLATLFS
ncbi:MAG: prepilin peptidase [Pseudomonadota bacterium]